MVFFQIVVMIAITLVAVEFGVHVIYHAITGKAGIDDPAFDYLGDLYNSVSYKHKKNYNTVEVLYREENYAG